MKKETLFQIESKSWFSSFYENLKDVFFKTELPPIVITAQPIEVADIWKDRDASRTKVGAISFVIHIGLALLVAFGGISYHKEITKVAKETVELIAPTAFVVKKNSGGGGGGRREVTPPSKGKLPRSSNKQLTPPTPKIVNIDPVLPVEPTLIMPNLDKLPSVDVANLGDPSGIPGPPSSGPGTGGGIGSGTGGGVGPGKGGGFGPGEGGGTGGGVFRIGGGVSAPMPIYRVEPSYSEEARKAKYQGSVIIKAIVRKDGSIDILKIVRGLGLGLDENAVSALRQWKFRPGLKDGVPVDVALNIEVNFTLR